MTDMKLSHLKFLALGLLATTSLAQASTNGFVVPSWRGSANSESGYWENFSVAFGAPGNLADRPGATTGAVFTQHDTNAFLTGTLNIYNPYTTNTYSLSDVVPFTLGSVVLQARAAANPLDYDSMKLSYTVGANTFDVAPLFRIELSTAAGGVSSLWQWDLTGLGITDYTITFAAANSSSSFDSMTLDTWNQFTAVPEPAAAAVGAVGGLIFLATKRFSRRQVKV